MMRRFSNVGQNAANIDLLIKGELAKRRIIGRTPKLRRQSAKQDYPEFLAQDTNLN